MLRHWFDPATRDYLARRRVQGKTDREIRRCLARYVARQLYRLLEGQPTLDTIGASRSGASTSGQPLHRS